MQQNHNHKSSGLLRIGFKSLKGLGETSVWDMDSGQGIKSNSFLNLDSGLKSQLDEKYKQKLGSKTLAMSPMTSFPDQVEMRPTRQVDAESLP